MTLVSKALPSGKSTRQSHLFLSAKCEWSPSGVALVLISHSKHQYEQRSFSSAPLEIFLETDSKWG